MTKTQITQAYKKVHGEQGPEFVAYCIMVDFLNGESLEGFDTDCLEFVQLVNDLKKRYPSKWEAAQDSAYCLDFDC